MADCKGPDDTARNARNDEDSLLSPIECGSLRLDILHANGGEANAELSALDEETTPRPPSRTLPTCVEEGDATPKPSTLSLPLADESEVATPTPATHLLPEINVSADVLVLTEYLHMPIYLTDSPPSPTAPSLEPAAFDLQELDDEFRLPSPALLLNIELPPVSRCYLLC